MNALQRSRPVDSYEFQLVTELRKKGRGWQSVAQSIKRTVEDTKRLYGMTLPVVQAKGEPTPPPPPQRTYFDARRLYVLPDRVTLICKEVCDRHGVTMEDVKGLSRKKGVIRPRQELMARLMDAGKSTTWVGNFLGGRDHTTTLHGAKVHKARLRRAAEGQPV